VGADPKNMYASKTSHPKPGVDGKPLTAFLAVDDPYIPKKYDRPSRVRGAQFRLPVTTKRDKETFPYQGNDYNASSSSYLKAQPIEDRKLGFGSHDAFRRDEFSNDRAVGIYRYALGREDVLRKKLSTGDALDNQIQEKQKEYEELCAKKRGIKTQSAAFVTGVPNHFFDNRSFDVDGLGSILPRSL
jgi:hypothetical protein